LLRMLVMLVMRAAEARCFPVYVWAGYSRPKRTRGRLDPAYPTRRRRGLS